MSDYAWVIEGGWTSINKPDYWVGSSAWSENPLRALRFARRQDAQQAADLMLAGVNVRICEHEWMPQMERIALEIFEEAMRSVELVHRVGESGFVEDWTALDQRPLPVHAKIVRTITVKRPEGNFDEGSVFRVQEQSEGVETETYWRATKVEPMGDGEIEVTAELVAAPSAPTG